MIFGSLFTGIGGFDLGLESAGMKCAYQVEIDPRCLDVLARHWPRVVRHRDVTTCGSSDLASVDLVCGGFPCQDVSVAGRRAGLAGKRSGLWWQFHRVIAELQPRWCVIENVPGLLHSNLGRDMGAIVGGLAELGYGWAYRVLDAQYFGVAQRRRRVFIVGCLGDATRAAQVLFEPESGERHTPPRRNERARVAASLTCGSAAGSRVNPAGRRREDDVNIVAAPLRAHEGQRDNVGETTWIVARPLAHGSTVDHYDESQQSYVVGFSKASHPLGSKELAEPITRRNGDPGCVAFCGMAQAGAGWAPPSTPSCEDCALTLDTTRAQAIVLPQAPLSSALDGVRRLTPVECERLQGFPDGWTDGQSDSARYRQLGNAVAVPVAAWIGRRIMLVEEGKDPNAAATDS